MAFTKINPLSRVTLFVKLESHDIYTIIYLIVGVGILNLATPVAIQALVNIVTMGGVLEPLYVISLILFILLTLSGVLYVLQAYLVEHIQRRFFVRTAIEAANNTLVSIGQEHSTQNTAELMNRFFDVSTIQKAAAQLLTNGLSSVLQAVIGSIVLMFYSFYFALIVLLMIFTLWFIVRVIGGRAIDTSIQESTTKYKVVAWLETISNNISAFKFL
jgi:ABC-type bacteriocin/lantibiotic exporter with double-glycine peptidase domain